MAITEAPFHPVTGSLMHYPERVYQGIGQYLEPEWRDVSKPFCLSIFCASMSRGRSAAYFIWRDANGATYPMFMTDMLEVIQKARIFNGCIVDGWFTIRKRGQNYGLALYEREISRVE